MNGQNNEFNSQFNSSKNNQSTQPVKNRFFSPDLFSDANVNEVGSSTSNNVSNNVISWGVGQKSSSPNVNNSIQQNQNQISNSQNILEQVNGVVYTEEQPEILDEAFLMRDINQPSVPFNSNQMGMANTSFSNNFNNGMSPQDNNSFVNSTPQVFQQNSMGMQQNEQLIGGVGQQQSFNQPLTASSIQPIQQPVPSIQQPQNNLSQVTPPDQSWREGLGVTQPTGEEWMNQQPLSAATLGVSQGLENAPKDVVKDSKFFNNQISSNLNNVQNKQEVQQQFVMQYNNGVAASLADGPATIVDEIALLKQYVGDNFTKINMAPFSFPTFLLGGFYFMYRKMYLLGIILYFIEFAILNFLSGIVASVAFLVFRIVLSLIVNPLYIKLAKLKVKGVAKNKANQKKNQIELNTICKRKGGTSFIKALILMILCVVIAVVFSFTVLSASIISKLFDFTLSGIVENDNGKYNGKIKTVEYDVFANMNIEIPAEFKKSDERDFYYEYTDPNINDDYNTCTLSVGKLQGYSSGEDFINQYIEYEELEENISKTSSKGITWYTITRENEHDKIHLRAGEINGDVVLFDYRVGANTTAGVCDVYLVDILSSISPKEK